MDNEAGTTPAPDITVETERAEFCELTIRPKITLSSSRDIPFNKLVLAQTNVRRLKAGVSIEDLAASIVRRGLIQSIHVRPVLGADGEETGMFEVPAGGRRYRVVPARA